VDLTGEPLVFSFSGLVVASVLVNLPFAVQPMQRAFEAIPEGARRGRVLRHGLLAAPVGRRAAARLARRADGLVLVFAHTLGEFGVVLMVGGSIPGETRTVAIAIYDRVQAFDFAAAGRMSLLLLVFSVTVLAIATAASARIGRRRARPSR
jgi:molybdate transport system permease protein